MRDLWVELLRLEYCKGVSVVLMTPPAILKGLRVPWHLLEVALEAFIIVMDLVGVRDFNRLFSPQSDAHWSDHC
jgi:hypothetical protein